MDEREIKWKNKDYDIIKKWAFAINFETLNHKAHQKNGA